MLRLAQGLVGFGALALDAIAIIYFGHWLSETDWLFGHVYGPASSILTAFWASVAGIVCSICWFTTALVCRRQSAANATAKNRRGILVGVILALLLIPTGLITFVGFMELPRARQQSRVQAMRAQEASLTELISALNSSDHELRFWAVEQLKSKGPEARDAVPSLAKALQDPVLGPLAAEALTGIGPDAVAAIPDLVEAIQREQGQRSETGSDTPSIISWLAGRALTRIGSPAIDELVELAGHQDRYVRMTAVSALGNMGSEAAGVAPTIKAAQGDSDPGVRDWAGVALERIEGRRPVAD